MYTIKIEYVHAPKSVDNPVIFTFDFLHTAIGYLNFSQRVCKLLNVEAKITLNIDVCLN